MSNDKNIAGSSYILTFFNELQLLNHNFSLYNNILSEFQIKYGEDIDLKKVGEEEKINLVNTSNQIKYYCTKIYIQHETIFGGAEFKKSEKILTIYNQINREYIIKLDNLKDFVIEINKVFFENMQIKDLLTTSKNIMDQIYNNG